jgi:hypothetical protein
MAASSIKEHFDARNVLVSAQQKKGTQALCHAMCTQTLSAFFVLLEIVIDISSCSFAVLGDVSPQGGPRRRDAL